MKKFIEILLSSQALKFGEFMTKAGRKSPYFVNFGEVGSAYTLGKMADCYAEHIAESYGSKVDNLYGPAYKGIPLALLTADRLSKILGKDISFTFNRKEKKNHGEGGWLVGHSYEPNENVLIIEDVISGGTSLRESVELLDSVGVKPIGAVVGIDRQEKGLGDKLAKQEMADRYGLDVNPIAEITQIADMLFQSKVLDKKWLDDSQYGAIKSYLKEYGTA